MCVSDNKKNKTMDEKKVNEKQKLNSTFAMKDLERTIVIPVESHIYSYITQSRQSEIITLERDSTLLAIMKPYLELKPVSEDECEPTEGYKMLTIVLPELRQVYNQKSKKVMYCNTLFRDHLSPKGVIRVNKYFKDNFKDKFRTAIDIYVEKQYDDMMDSGEKHRIKLEKGITSFLCQYHIEPTRKLIKSLARDWQRHRDRNDEYRYTPVFY